MEILLDPDLWIAFAMLTALEIVLGVDNIIFLSILVGRLPQSQRARARSLGLSFALLSRLLLLLSLSWVMGLTTTLFSVARYDISGRDLVFLLYKAAHEIFVEVEGHPARARAAGAGHAAFWGVIAQIAVIDIVFSLDSVITAVGMVNRIGVMVAAVVASTGVMFGAARPIGEFVARHPSVKVLALAFLVMVGMALSAEALDVHLPKGFIYGAMAFALVVEALNIYPRFRSV